MRDLGRSVFSSSSALRRTIRGHWAVVVASPTEVFAAITTGNSNRDEVRLL